MLNSKNILKKFSPGHKSFCRLGNKPVFYIILFLNFVFSSYAQENLIYNGDFEEYSECPIGATNPFQNPQEITKCKGWKAPTYGTSDFYHECAVGTNVSVPSSNLGFQNPYSGKGYLGSFLLSYGGAGTDGYNGNMWWEYIQGELIKPLEKGKIYSFSMQISLAEYSDLSISEFGAYFSQNPISSPNTAYLSVNPQCEFFNADFFKDTVNWVKIESSFIAEGGEKFVTIGNFNNDIETDTLRIYLIPGDIPPMSTYMFYDDVKLYEIKENLVFPNFFSPNNDGINDEWFVNGFDENEIILILNRWGTILKEEKVNTFKWNGTTDEGKMCSDGVYFYILKNSKKTGAIQLLR